MIVLHPSVGSRLSDIGVSESSRKNSCDSCNNVVNILSCKLPNEAFMVALSGPTESLFQPHSRGLHPLKKSIVCRKGRGGSIISLPDWLMTLTLKHYTKCFLNFVQTMFFILPIWSLSCFYTLSPQYPSSFQHHLVYQNPLDAALWIVFSS